MKKHFQIPLLFAVGLICANILVSCAPKGNSKGPSLPDLSTTSEPNGDQKSPITANGTSDSGGGTGIDGRVFESYIVDPTQLPAYKQYLENLLKNIKSDDPDAPHTGQIFKIKTWYIAPVNLDKLSKDVLGISFMKSDTQQIARQTMKEVWIDKRIFDQMNLQEQSELLLHELVMNMYFYKFMKMSELCRMSNLIDGEKNTDSDSCLSNAVILDKAMPAEKPHALTDEDNENIRFVTGWLLQHTQKPIAEKDFVSVLFYKGFDKRFFNPDNYGEKSSSQSEIKISKKEFYQAVKGAELSGHMPDLCFANTSDMSKHCKVELEEKSIPYQNFSMQGFTLRLSVENETPINVSFLSGDEISMSASQDTDGSIIYTHALVDWQTKIQIGDRIYSGFFIFKKDSSEAQSHLILESVILRPGIVVSIDKKRDQICQLRSPKVINFTDDGITARRANSEPGLIDKMLLTTQPFAACSTENVVE